MDDLKKKNANQNVAQDDTEELSEEKLSEQRGIRRDKLRKLQDAGRNPFLHEKWNVTAHSMDIKEYYDSKRSEGRGHYNALGHCAGKLVRIIYKMLKDNVEFKLD